MSTKVKRQIFYSFHFKNDFWRVQQIRNMGVFDGNQPVSHNSWEEVKEKGNDSIKKWIDDNMKNRSCVVVLIGEDTANSDWVTYEISKAWNDGKGLLGIYIHNLKDSNSDIGKKGRNPFDNLQLKSGKKLSEFITCYNPNSNDVYNDIRYNMENWIESAIESANTRK
jgi:hypothetical protein